MTGDHQQSEHDEGKTMNKGLVGSRSERGQATGTLIVVVLVVGIAVVLLTRTALTAVSINDKAENIAQTGRGINAATDAILQLDKTNQLGASILQTSGPLVGQLDKIVGIARSIDGLATTITGSAVSINGEIRGINGQTTAILSIAQSINRGAEQINRSVDTTIALARDIKLTLDSIIPVERSINQNAVGIDSKLPEALNSLPDLPVPNL